jgi:FkbM family methyltransferase
MYKQLKSYLKRYQSLVTLYETVHRMKYNTIHNMRDIRDSYLRKGRKTEETPYGFKLRGSSSVHHQGMQKGTFEVDETELILQYLSRSDVFIDVGANIGYYSCMARSLGKQVIAVEPLSRNLKYLYANLMENNWLDVEVFPLGLSDRPGIAVLYGASSTGASLISNWAGSSKRFKRVVPISTLDILLGHRFDRKRIFIKIDVEGVEYQVLMGAIETLKIVPRPIWLIEICLSEFYPNGINPNYAATFEIFWQKGYEVRTADSHSRLIQNSDVQRWAEAGRCETGVINYFFLPKSS